MNPLNTPPPTVGGGTALGIAVGIAVGAVFDGSIDVVDGGSVGQYPQLFMQFLRIWVIQAESVQNPMFFHKSHSWNSSSHCISDPVGRCVGAADVGGAVLGADVAGRNEGAAVGGEFVGLVVVGFAVVLAVGAGLIVGGGVRLNVRGVGLTTKVSEMLTSRMLHCTWSRRQVYARRSKSVRSVMGTLGSMIVWLIYPMAAASSMSSS